MSGAALCGAAPPTLDVCGPGCRELNPIGVLVVDCGGIPPWTANDAYGRQWWGPLLSVGRVEISLLAPKLEENPPFPLFVEIRQDPGAVRCVSLPGNVVWQTYGTTGSCNPDSLWVTSPPIDIPAIVGLGNEYWLQVEGFVEGPDLEHLRTSPYLACVRVRPIDSAVASSDWGRVKALYR